MKKIKTFLVVCLMSVISVINVYGQDMAAATDMYNAGATALSESNFVAAIESFNKALKMLDALSAEDRGEEGDALVKEVKEVLPQIYLRYGKGLASSGEVGEAVVQLKKAIESAKVVSAADVVEEAEDLIPQLLLVNASNLLNDGNLEGAVEGFKQVIELQPENSAAYLRMGLAYSRLNQEEEAIEAFEKAAEMGDADNAPRQLAVIYLRRSAAASRTRAWADVFENAKKANEYNETSNGHKLIGLAGVQLKKYDEAIAALDSYLLSEPNARDRNSILYNLAVAYEAKNDNAKACGYYKQLVNDATYKQIAEYKVNTQLKCN